MAESEESERTWTDPRRNTLWLLEPQGTTFPSPHPAGSLTDLRSGNYRYQGSSPTTMANDLHRCNDALLQLMIQNAFLTSQLEEKNSQLSKPDVADKVTQTDFEGVEGSDWMVPSSESRNLFPEQYYALARIADQESAIKEYRSVLESTSYERGRLEGLVGNMAYQTRMLLTQLERSEEYREMEAQVATERQKEMEWEMQERAQQAEAQRLELEVEITRLRSMLGNADSKMREFHMLVASLNSDLVTMRGENNQLKQKVSYYERNETWSESWDET